MRGLRRLNGNIRQVFNFEWLLDLSLFLPSSIYCVFNLVLNILAAFLFFLARVESKNSINGVIVLVCNLCIVVYVIYQKGGGDIYVRTVVTSMSGRW